MKVQGKYFEMERDIHSNLKSHKDEGTKQIGLTRLERTSILSSKLVDKANQISNTALKVAALSGAYFLAIIEALTLVSPITINLVDLTKHYKVKSIANKITKALHEHNENKNSISPDKVAKEMGVVFAEHLFKLDPAKRKNVVAQTLKYLESGHSKYSNLERSQRVELTQIFAQSTAKELIKLRTQEIVETVNTPSDFFKFGKSVDALSEHIAEVFGVDVAIVRGPVETAVYQAIVKVEKENNNTDFSTIVQLKDSFVLEMVGNKDALTIEEEHYMASFNKEYKVVTDLEKSRSQVIEKALKKDIQLVDALKQQKEAKQVLSRINAKLEQVGKDLLKRKNKKDFKLGDNAFKAQIVQEANEKYVAIAAEKQVTEKELQRLEALIENRTTTLKHGLNTKLNEQISHEQSKLLKKFVPKLRKLYNKIANYDASATYGGCVLSDTIASISSGTRSDSDLFPLASIADETYDHYEFENYEIKVTKDLATALFARALAKSVKENPQRFQAADFLVQLHAFHSLSDDRSFQDLEREIQLAATQCQGDDREFKGLEQLIEGDKNEIDPAEQFVDQVVKSSDTAEFDKNYAAALKKLEALSI